MQTRISQLEIIAPELDTCHCDPITLVKEILSQMNRSKFREDTTCTKKLIEKTWNEKTKVETIYFEGIIAAKDWKSFTIWNF